MKVRLVDFTGIEAADPLYAARLLVYTKSTRLEQGENTRHRINAMTNDEVMSELKYIANTLRSSWEFVDYTFEISGVTRAFTHQLVRTRTGTYAQQAQRVVGMASFTAERPVTCPEGTEAGAAWDSCMNDIRTRYSQLQALGVPNQDCRGVLPTNVHTNIIAKFNLRTMADLIAKRENLRAQGEFVDVAKAMKAEMLRVHPWVAPFIDPDRTKTPALDELLKRELGTSGPLDKPRLNEALKELDTLKGIWG